MTNTKTDPNTGTKARSNTNNHVIDHTDANINGNMGSEYEFNE